MDEETGYYNYGARYYDPSLSIWTGVDPLADEAPGWTPYRYGFNNPVRMIDPDGRFETEAEAQRFQEENNITGGIYEDNGAFFIQGTGDFDGQQYAYGAGGAGFEGDQALSFYPNNAAAQDNLQSIPMVDPSVSTVSTSHDYAIDEGLHIWGDNPYGSLIEGESNYKSATSMDMITMPRYSKDQRSILQLYKSISDKTKMVNYLGFSPTLVRNKGRWDHLRTCPTCSVNPGGDTLTSFLNDGFRRDTLIMAAQKTKGYFNFDEKITTVSDTRNK